MHRLLKAGVAGLYLLQVAGVDVKNEMQCYGVSDDDRGIVW